MQFRNLLLYSLLLLLLVASGPVRADVLHLKDGRRIEGKIVAETDTKVTIRLSYGITTFARDEIDRIERSDSEATADRILEEGDRDDPDTWWRAARAAREKGRRSEADRLEAKGCRLYVSQRLEALEAPDAETLMALARDLHDRGFPAKDFRLVLKRVLLFDSEHEEARRALGHVRLKDRWLPPEEQRRLGLHWLGAPRPVLVQPAGRRSSRREAVRAGGTVLVLGGAGDGSGRLLWNGHGASVLGQAGDVTLFRVPPDTGLGEHALSWESGQGEPGVPVSVFVVPVLPEIWRATRVGERLHLYGADLESVGEQLEFEERDGSWSEVDPVATHPGHLVLEDWSGRVIRPRVRLNDGTRIIGGPVRIGRGERAPQAIRPELQSVRRLGAYLLGIGHGLWRGGRLLHAETAGGSKLAIRARTARLVVLEDPTASVENVRVRYGKKQMDTSPVVPVAEAPRPGWQPPDGTWQEKEEKSYTR